jgi:hypothetical protein
VATVDHPQDGGGNLSEKVARLYWITDDHGRRIAKLEDSEILTFMTRMQINFDNLVNRVQRVDNKVDIMRTSVDKKIDKVSNQVGEIILNEAGDQAVSRRKGDIISRVVIPLTSAAAVLVALLALLTQ